MSLVPASAAAAASTVAAASAPRVWTDDEWRKQLLLGAQAVDRLAQQQLRISHTTGMLPIGAERARFDLLARFISDVDINEHMRRHRYFLHDSEYVRLFVDFRHNLNPVGKQGVARRMLKFIWKHFPGAWKLFPNDAPRYMENMFPPTVSESALMRFWMSRADEALLQAMLTEIDEKRFLVPQESPYLQAIERQNNNQLPWMLPATLAVRAGVQELLTSFQVRQFNEANAMMALQRPIMPADVLRHIIVPMVSSGISRDSQPRIAADPRMRSLQVLNELDQTRVQPHTADAQKYQRVREILDNLSQLDREAVVTRLREIVGSADMSDDDNNAAPPSGLTQALRALCDALDQNPNIARSNVHDELTNLLRTMPR